MCFITIFASRLCLDELFQVLNTMYFSLLGSLLPFMLDGVSSISLCRGDRFYSSFNIVSSVHIMDLVLKRYRKSVSRGTSFASKVKIFDQRPKVGAKVVFDILHSPASIMELIGVTVSGWYGFPPIRVPSGAADQMMNFVTSWCGRWSVYQSAARTTH